MLALQNVSGSPLSEAMIGIDQRWHWGVGSDCERGEVNWLFPSESLQLHWIII